jgi:hypothetical protein
MKKSSYFWIIITSLALIFSFCGAIAQTGTLKGKVIDEKTKEPIPFASVAIEKGGKLITGTSANIEGNYFIKTIPSGIYYLRVTDICHYTMMVSNIIIKNDSITYQDIKLSFKPFSTIRIDYFPPPMITKEPVPSGRTYTSEEINKMAW